MNGHKIKPSYVATCFFISSSIRCFGTLIIRVISIIVIFINLTGISIRQVLPSKGSKSCSKSKSVSCTIFYNHESRARVHTNCVQLKSWFRILFLLYFSYFPSSDSRVVADSLCGLVSVIFKKVNWTFRTFSRVDIYNEETTGDCRKTYVRGVRTLSWGSKIRPVILMRWLNHLDERICV